MVTRKTKLIGCGCVAPLFVLLAVALFAIILHASNQAEIEAAREDCRAPAVFRLDPAGEGRLAIPRDWQCAAPSTIRAEQEVVAANEEEVLDNERRRIGAEQQRALQQEESARHENFNEQLATLARADQVEEIRTAAAAIAFAPDETLSSQTIALRTAIRGLGEPPAEPEAPVAPIPPETHDDEYRGARAIAGRFHSNYHGGLFEGNGIVIRSRGRYLVVIGAEVNGMSRQIRGYASPTGRTASLDIGRDGREAEIWVFADQESAEDDRRRHAEAHAIHATEVRTYQTTQRDFIEAERAFEHAHASYEDSHNTWESEVHRLSELAREALAVLE